MKNDTLLVHAGRDPQAHAGMVNTPVFRTSTVIFPTLASYQDRKSHGDKFVRYGRHGTPTTYAFEEAVASLEGGYKTAAVPNGLAAIVASLTAYARPGAHLLMPDSVYTPARRFCEGRLASWGVRTEFYAPRIGAGIAGRLTPDTVAVYCESPGSQTFEVQDIPAIAAAAHARGIPVIADNTWATPYFLRPFELGVDVSIHAATKYIGGHSDLMMGVITANETHWDAIHKAVDDLGYSVSPDDCYQGLRGLRTLGVRLRQQMGNAVEVARWLERQPQVAAVNYPALESHPDHALWRRDFGGAASLFAVELRPEWGGRVQALVDSLTLFGIGSSWGGYESLVNLVQAGASRTATAWTPAGPVLRLHVGMEDPQDLIADLKQGFSAAAS
ncbi:cystathionine beta-lyase [Achromobacter aloeverae]|uniref:Cystathionine beta-lyase n=1 Tax=Achromobacter aloeverae TaxID=1750518 RepID=A0A4Q1HEH5_9BURK|nr:cystathionine beta-lyase [Achromobacter aloeverae]RXN83790.1 cystathionine beta-lyase [Achromobacter aloeverae]